VVMPVAKEGGVGHHHRPETVGRPLDQSSFGFNRQSTAFSTAAKPTQTR
jgi:hypothetical protein